MHRYRITRTLNAEPSAKTSPSSEASAGARRQTVQIDVHVSPGWTTGTRIRVPRVGNQRPDGSFQDIVFVVAEAPHPRFVRKGDHLVLPVRVPWIDTHSHATYPPGGLYSEADSDLGHDGGRYRFGAGVFRQMRHGLMHGHGHGPEYGHPPEEEDEVYVRGINGEEYTIPIPRTLVEAADGTRIYGAGMPVRKNGCVVGMGDMVIRCVSSALSCSLPHPFSWFFVACEAGPRLGLWHHDAREVVADRRAHDRWEFVFPESEKLQRSRWQTLKDAMHLKLPV